MSEPQTIDQVLQPLTLNGHVEKELPSSTEASDGTNSYKLKKKSGRLPQGEYSHNYKNNRSNKYEFRSSHHPLQFTWYFSFEYYENKTINNSNNENNSTKKKQSSISESLGPFNSVESFYTKFSQISSPSNWPVGAKAHLLRKGVHFPLNRTKNSAQWVIEIQASTPEKFNQVWEMMVLKTIGSKWEFGEVLGFTLVKLNNKLQVRLYKTNAKDWAENFKLGNSLRIFLGLDQNVNISYTPLDNVKEKFSFKEVTQVYTAKEVHLKATAGLTYTPNTPPTPKWVITSTPSHRITPPTKISTANTDDTHTENLGDVLVAHTKLSNRNKNKSPQNSTKSLDESNNNQSPTHTSNEINNENLNTTTKTSPIYPESFTNNNKNNCSQNNIINEKSLNNKTSNKHEKTTQPSLHTHSQINNVSTKESTLYPPLNSFDNTTHTPLNQPSPVPHITSRSYLSAAISSVNSTKPISNSKVEVPAQN